MRTIHIPTLAFALVAIFVLAACGTQNDSPADLIVVANASGAAASQTPGPVVIPATPLQSPTPSASPTPSDTPLPPTTATPLPTLPPGVDYGPVVGPDHTLMPTETRQPTTPLPPATLAPGVNYGAIVGPGHTLVPTETRVPPALPPSAVPTEGPSPTPGPGLARHLVGIQIHPHIDSREFDQVLADLKDLNVGWVKVQFNWSLLESAPGQYTELFYILRTYVRRFHTEGFRVMISVAKAPGWSRTPDADGIMRENGPPDDPQALANFLSAMLTDIGWDDQGQPYVDAIQVWNEPNLQREWYGYALTGGEYMRYFRPAYDAIRSVYPNTVVITAAPAPTGDSKWSTNDRTWLQQLYNAGLAQYGTDVSVGIHPYGWANPPSAHCCPNPGRGWDDKPQFFFLDTVEDYHAIMAANGHSNAQLWATEFGWATFDGLQTSSGSQPPNPPDTPYFGYIDRWQQAAYTVQAFTLAQERPYLGPMILWNLNFSTLTGAVDGSDPKAGYALLDSRWQPRPVYQELKQAINR
jgi:hypothetical protein